MKYDIFVSYRWIEPYMSWVRESLIPALKDGGLKVAYDIEVFIPGKNDIQEMKRIIQECRYVLCVICTDYLTNSDNTKMEILMGLIRDNSTLIPFIIEEKILLPDYLKRTIPVNWTIKNNNKTEWYKLLISLNAPYKKADPPRNLDFYKKRHFSKTNKYLVDKDFDNLTIVLSQKAIYIGGSLYIYIPGGNYFIGSNKGYPHEAPKHKVKLSSFFLKATPVTNNEFRHFFIDNNYEEIYSKYYFQRLKYNNGKWCFSNKLSWETPDENTPLLDIMENNPVVQINWYDAKAYCEWLSNKTNLKFDLPTECQWEGAAATSNSYTWSWGNKYKKGIANIETTGTCNVCKYSPNHFGLYDMIGNVYEWCNDWYTENWENAGHNLYKCSHNPQGSLRGNEKILKGGSWYDIPQHARCANRFHTSPFLSSSNWGFRPCLYLNDNLINKLITNKAWLLDAKSMLEI